MSRRFYGLAALALVGLFLTVLSVATPVRAQELPEAWSAPPVPAGADSTKPDALFFYFEGNNRADGGDAGAAIRLYRRSLALDTAQVAVRLALARAYAAREQPDSMLYWAEQVCRRDSSLAEAHRIAGFACLRLGRGAQAIDELRRALELDPSDTASVMNLLFLLESTKRYEEALALINSAEKDLGESPPLRVRRARLLVQTGRGSEAVTDLVSLLGAQPDFPEGEMILALALSRGPEALADTAAVEALLRRHPLLARTRTALARLYLGAGRYPEAQAHLELLAASDPSDTRILRDLGVLCFRQGKYGEAEARFRDLQKASPRDPEPLRWLSRLALVQQRPEDAIRLAGSALARAPGDPDALLCQATGLLTLGRREEALLSAEAVLQRDPTRREAGLLAAAVLDDLGRSGEAVDRLRPIATSYPDDRDVLFALGASLERAGEIDSSLVVFDRLLAANPDDDEALNHSGYMCIDRGIQLDAALARVRRALDRAPEKGAYLDSYGWGLFRLGRNEEALDWLRRAAEKSPKEAEIRLHLGEVLEALDRAGDARLAYQEALRLRPDDREIQRRLEAVGKQPALEVPASK